MERVGHGVVVAEEQRGAAAPEQALDLGDDVGRELLGVEPIVEKDFGNAEGFDLGEVFGGLREALVESGAGFG